jgi:hypothetical protein
LHICVPVGRARLRNFDIEINFGAIRRAHESCIPLMQDAQEIRIGRIDAHGHATDLNREAEALDVGD